MPRLQDAALALPFTADKQEILLVKRRDVPVWVLPGGGIESGETPEEAAIRETLEESGCHVKIERKVSELTPPTRMIGKAHLFECRVTGGTPQPTDESSETRFFPVNELPKRFFALHRFWLEEAMSDSKETIKRPMHELFSWWFAWKLIKDPVLGLYWLRSRFKKES